MVALAKVSRRAHINVYSLEVTPVGLRGHAGTGLTPAPTQSHTGRLHPRAGNGRGWHGYRIPRSQTRAHVDDPGGRDQGNVPAAREGRRVRGDVLRRSAPHLIY